jgi:hypothetical protein
MLGHQSLEIESLNYCLARPKLAAQQIRQILNKQTASLLSGHSVASMQGSSSEFRACYARAFKNKC